MNEAIAPRPAEPPAVATLLRGLINAFKPRLTTLVGGATPKWVGVRVRAQDPTARIVPSAQATPGAELDLLYLEAAADGPALAAALDRLWPAMAVEGLFVAQARGAAVERACRDFAEASGAAYLSHAEDGFAVLATTAEHVSWLVRRGFALERASSASFAHVSGRRSRLLLRSWGTPRAPLRVMGDTLAGADAGLAAFAVADELPHLIEHVVDRARVVGDNMTVTANGSLVDETIRWHRRAPARESHERALAANDSIKLEHGLLIAVSPLSNYYHWMIESLFSLYLYRRYRPQQPLTVLSAPLSAYEADTLRLLGADDLPIRILNKGKSAEVASLTLLSPTFGHGVAQLPPALLDMFDVLRDAAGVIAPVSPTGARRLYVSRTDSPSRRLENEALLAERLQHRGFELVTLSGLPVAEQARLFAEAEVVVAPHGAGLANLGFCRPGTRVLELSPSHYLNPCFLTLSQAARLHHHTYVGTTPDTGGARHRRSWSVNLDRVTTLVDQLLAGRIDRRLWAGAERNQF